MTNEPAQSAKNVIYVLTIFLLAFIGFCFLCCGIPALIGWFTLT